jgi:hypothetical protein
MAFTGLQRNVDFYRDKCGKNHRNEDICRVIYQSRMNGMACFFKKSSGMPDTKTQERTYPHDSIVYSCPGQTLGFGCLWRRSGYRRPDLGRSRITPGKL